MEKTNIKVKFKIIGNNFDPNIITEKMGIKPTEIWKEGEKVINRKKDIKRKYDCWLVSTDYEESFDINIQLKKIVNILTNKEAILAEIKKDKNIDYFFEIIINIEKGETPAIYLEKDIIEFACNIKAEFDFDLYIL